MSGGVIALARGRSETDAGLLWRALADPTRRRILDLLRERPRVTGEIAAQFPVSRIAVMRHLEVLSEAGLAVSRKRGRQRWHYLNTVPLQDLHRRWAEPTAARFAAALLRLQDSVEGEGRHMESMRPARCPAGGPNLSARGSKSWCRPGHGSGLTPMRRPASGQSDRRAVDSGNPQSTEGATKCPPKSRARNMA